jgi:hypothetical protein
MSRRLAREVWGVVPMQKIRPLSSIFEAVDENRCLHEDFLASVVRGGVVLLGILIMTCMILLNSSFILNLNSTLTPCPIVGAVGDSPKTGYRVSDSGSSGQEQGENKDR